MDPKFTIVPLVILALSSPLGAEPLKIKAGLWETTTVTEKSGTNRPSNLDSLKPDQRAKVEKKLTDRTRKETRNVRACLSEAQIASGETFIGKTHLASCTRSFEIQTAGDLVATLDCSGANAMTGRIEMHAADPEHMNGTVDMTYGTKGKLQLFTHSAISARWMGGDCGTVTADSSRPH